MTRRTDKSGVRSNKRSSPGGNMLRFVRTFAQSRRSARLRTHRSCRRRGSHCARGNRWHDDVARKDNRHPLPPPTSLVGGTVRSSQDATSPLAYPQVLSTRQTQTLFSGLISQVSLLPGPKYRGLTHLSRNSGNFLFRADVLLSEIERLAPDISSAVKVAVARASDDLSASCGCSPKPSCARRRNRSTMP
jgi:hypothetical protein